MRTKRDGDPGWIRTSDLQLRLEPLILQAFCRACRTVVAATFVFMPAGVVRQPPGPKNARAAARSGFAGFRDRMPYREKWGAKCGLARCSASQLSAGSLCLG